MPRGLVAVAGVMTLVCSTGCFHVAALSLAVDANNPLNYRTLHVVVVDAHSGAPVPGARVSTLYGEYGVKLDAAVTGAEGTAKIRVWKWHPQLMVEAPGYARGILNQTTGQPGAPNHLTLTVAPPVLVGIELVVPHDWRGPITVVEYVGDDASQPSADAGTESRLELSPTRVTVRAFFRLPESGRPTNIGADFRRALADRSQPPEVYRVVSARDDAGSAVPVFRNTPPPDGGFGLYHVGYSSCDEDGYAGGLFVLGTLLDARAVAGERAGSQWSPNVAIVGRHQTR